MKCCGENRSTPFCPMCGKKLSEDPLFVLLMYLRKHSEALRNKSQGLVDMEADPGQYWSKPSAIRSRKVTIAKWDAWVEAIETMMARDAERTKQDD